MIVFEQTWFLSKMAAMDVGRWPPRNSLQPVWRGYFPAGMFNIPSSVLLVWA